MAKAINSSYNVAWIQPDGPGTTPRMLTCYSLDSITNPKGSLTRNMCWDAVAGKYEVSSVTQDPPDMPSMSLEGLTQAAADYLEKTMRKDCAVYIYINTVACSPRGSFNGWSRSRILKALRCESEEAGGVLAREGQETSTESYDFVATNGIEKAFSAAIYTHTTAKTEEARSLLFLGGPTCAGDCGPEVEMCEIGYLGEGGAAAAVGIVDYTTDGGATWLATSAVPFAANPALADVGSLVAFPVGGHIWRLVAGAATTWAANEPQVSWADVDIIATPQTTVWNQVAVTPCVAADYLPWNGSLFANDAYHIWCGTSGGEIAFSEDGALTWTLQLVAIADMIRCIRFDAESTFGVYCGGTAGASRVLGYTTDGGLNWTAVTGTGLPAATVMANGISILSEAQWVMCLENGTVYKTWDQGTNWTLLPQPTVAGLTAWGDLHAIQAIDECCLWACGEATVSAVSRGVILRSINGGYNWDAWLGVTGDATLGEQCMFACSYNECHAAGDEQGAVLVTHEVTD